MRRSALLLPLATTAVLAACSPSEPVAAPDDQALEEAAATAGCETAEHEPDGEPAHFAPDAAPPADELYTIRPPMSGPHFGSWLDVDVYGGPIDERAAVHNLEHGAIVVWYDPGGLEEGAVQELIAWAEERNDGGLASARVGAGLIVAPYDGAELSQPLAFRAWQVTGDCAGFDRRYADMFVLRYFGSRGHAPEGNLAPDVDRAYPDER